MIVFQAQSYVKYSEIDHEAGGAALVFQVEGDEGHFFVRFQSYDEKAWTDEQSHETMKKLIGKKVKVTVEIIE